MCFNKLEEPGLVFRVPVITTTRAVIILGGLAINGEILKPLTHPDPTRLDAK